MNFSFYLRVMLLTSLEMLVFILIYFEFVFLVFVIYLRISSKSYMYLIEIYQFIPKWECYVSMKLICLYTRFT